MKLSIIIPTYNKIERLRLALCSYEAQSLEKDAFEVIVVADATDVGIEQSLTGFKQKINLKLLVTAERGMPRVRNLGAENARGDYLGFFDDDVMLCPTYLEEALLTLGTATRTVVRAPVYTLYAMKYFKDPEQGIPYPEYADQIARRPIFRTALISREMILSNWEQIAKQCNKLNRFERIVRACLTVRNGKQVLPWMGLSGSGIVLHKSAFFSAGGYDDQLGKWWGAESIDLGYRLNQDSCAFTDLPHVYSAHMDHPREESLKKFKESFMYVFEKYSDPNIRLISEMIWSNEDIDSALERRV